MSRAGARWRLLVPALVALALGVPACGGGGGADPAADAAPPDAFLGSAAALFEVPRGAPPPSGFYALPYPNDIRVDDQTGRIDLGDHIRPNAIITEYLDVIAERQRGFSLNAAGFVRFDNPIDPASLPVDPEASRAGGASVYLVNVDESSPSYGERVPLRFRFEHYAGEVIGTNWLSMLPYPGFRLDEQTTYAFVATNRLRATDGTAVATAADFAAIAATSVPADPHLARAQTLYQPLWTWLDQPGGDERADVIAAAVFTTQDATSLMGKLRQAVWQLDPPSAREIVWKRDEHGYAWYDAKYDAPNFQRGEVPYSRPEDGGDLNLDENGDPQVYRTEEMRVSFTVPLGEMPPNGWPVVIYAHGTGGDYHSFRNGGAAKYLAAEGLAVFGIDQVLHGPRAPGTDPAVSFFNFQNPLSARDSTLQGATDNFTLLRLIRSFDYTERHKGGRTIRFDPDRVYFFGHSQGGLTGPPFLAHEPLVEGAVLSGAGGLLYLSLTLKTQPVDVASIVAAFIRDWPLDEFNPMLAIIQGYMDRTDPVSYGPLLVREPPPGVTPKHIYQSEGFTDTYTPLPSIEGLATSIGLELVQPVIADVPGLTLRGGTTQTAPVTGNLAGVTGVLAQYQALGNSDGHFVIFNVPAAIIQSAKFLGTLSREGSATLVAPP